MGEFSSSLLSIDREGLEDSTKISLQFLVKNRQEFGVLHTTAGSDVCIPDTAEKSKTSPPSELVNCIMLYGGRRKFFQIPITCVTTGLCLKTWDYFVLTCITINVTSCKTSHPYYNLDQTEHMKNQWIGLIPNNSTNCSDITVERNGGFFVVLLIFIIISILHSYSSFLLRMYKYFTMVGNYYPHFKDGKTEIMGQILTLLLRASC